MADYGIAATVVPPKLDFLSTLGNAQDLRAKMLNNRLLGYQLDSKTAAGRALGGAIDPTSGLPDPAKVGQFFTQNPDQAPYAADALTAAQALKTGQIANQGGEITNDTNALNLTLKKLDSATGALDSSLTDKSPFTPDRLVSTIRNVIQMGHFQGDQHAMQMAVQALTGAPQPTGNPQADDQAMRQYVQGLSVQFRNSSDHINTLLGSTQNINTGPMTLTERAGGIGPNGLQVVGATGMGLSPADSIAQNFTVVGPDGTPGVITKGATAAAQANGGAPTVIPTGQPAGSVEAMALGKTGGAAQGVAFRGHLADAANQWGDVHGTLANFRGLVDQIASGPKVGTLKGIGQIAAQFGLPAPVSKDETAAMEEAGKLAYQIAQRQFQQLGGTGTDSKLDSAMHTSPSEFLSAEGNKRIIPILQGNNDAIKAQQDAYEVWARSHGPQDYTDFVRQWNQRYDPRVFQAAYMDPAQVTAMRNGMDKTERQNFDSFQAFAKTRGWLHGGK